ncbi:MAG: cytochrome C biogenesis protein CcdA [Paracoccaceae bacterium]|nr:MAG: cytochrome c biogenesis protein CcdA [Alphaproteobacteria bacterium]GIX13741.1 MAG: cytochrome C biogenesis protein CcdA [Paracoccaceae bacterium]
MELEVGLGGAALAGLVSFLSPCILPIVPFYLCFIAGVSMQDMQEGAASAATRSRLIVTSVFFALGVTTIFVLLGLGASALGQAFRQWQTELSWVAAGLLALFGLHFLGLIRIPLLYREARIEARAAPATIIGAYLMGLAFGFGWTPCAGPVLAAILFMAAGQGAAGDAALLLLAYGLGMTLPFVATAAFSGPVLRWMSRFRRHLGVVEKAMGVMLIVFAALIATNSVSWIAQWMIEAFPVLLTIG